MKKGAERAVDLIRAALDAVDDVLRKEHAHPNVCRASKGKLAPVPGKAGGLPPARNKPCGCWHVTMTKAARRAKEMLTQR